MSNREEFADRLKRARMRRCWTLKQMSAVTGLSISGLSELERGLKNPHDLTVARLHKALPDDFPLDFVS